MDIERFIFHTDNDEFHDMVEVVKVYSVLKMCYTSK